MSEIESLIFYFFIFAVSTVCFGLHKKNDKRIARIGIILSIVIPSIVAGYRYDVGTDYNNYYNLFSKVENYSYQWIFTDKWHFNVERGFLTTSKVFSRIFGTKAIFGVFAFFIVSIFVYTVLKQYEGYNQTLMYFLFIIGPYMDSYNTLRQGISLVILFWGLKFVFEGNLVKYGFTVLTASLFHFTAILSAPVYFLWNHKRGEGLSTSKKLGIYTTAIIMVLVWRPLLESLRVVFNNLYLLKYATYLMGNETNNRSFYLKLVLGVIFIIFEKKYVKYDKRFSLFVNMYIIGVILEYTGFYITFVKRMGWYYGTYTGILLMATLPVAFAGKGSRSIARMFIVLYEVALFLIVSFALNQGGCFPYKTQVAL